jgi:hypothetical protein
MSKKLYFFLFYLSLDIKDLLLLGLEGLILSELYIPSGLSFKEFSLNYLYWVFLRVSIIIS